MSAIESSSKTQLFSHLARVAKALASPVRLQLLEALAQGEHSVDELARAAGVPTANASHHLQVLRDGGLVHSRRDVGSIDASFKAHGDVLGAEPVFDMFNPQWPIFSSNYQGPVARVLGG